MFTVKGLRFAHSPTHRLFVILIKKHKESTEDVGFVRESGF